MAIWSVNLAGGISPILYYSAQGIQGNTIIVFLSAIVAVIAASAAPMVSVSDFTKSARSTKAQSVGHSLGLIFAYLLFALASITIIVGSQKAFGTPIWNVLDVIDRFDSGFAIGLSILTLCLTALAVNVTGNIVPAGYQLASLFPKKVNFKSGAMIAASIAIIILPWKLMENPESILGFLHTVSGLLAPITGIMLAHYYVIAKREIDLNELFSKTGKYNYRNGFNYNAIIALIIAGVLSLIGNFVSFFEALYMISWFVGIISAFIIYLLLEKVNSSD